MDKPTNDEIVHLFDNLLNDNYNQKDPGAAILILINNHIVYQRCFGLANLDKNEKITFETNFRLASLTKQFTAYAILLLAQQDKLSLTNTLGQFFSDKFKTKCPILSTKITIQHLLDQWSDYDVLETMNDKIYFEPGTQYRYSNTGYILLGLIIEIVSNQSLEDFFCQYIFQPFDMKTSIVYNSYETVIKNRALGYIKRVNEGKYELCDQSATSATRGDGGIYMSMKDYLQWYHHSRISLSTIFPIDENLDRYYYSLGWFLNDSNGKIRLHIGNSCGFSHQVFRIDDEERKILVVYLSNIGDNNENINKFNRLIVEKIPQLNPDNTKLLWEMGGLTR